MGITLEQARLGIGRLVIYRSPAQRAGRDRRPAEEGRIASVGREHVFVTYPNMAENAATRPEDLDFSIDAVDEDDRQDKLHDARQAMDTFKEHS